MKKAVIVILILMLIVMIGIVVFRKIKIKKDDIWIDVEHPNCGSEAKLPEEKPKEIGRMIKVNGTLYCDTGIETTGMLWCGTLDGNITKIIDETEIPQNDGEANFEGATGYQYSKENTIEVPIDGRWCTFEAKEHSFCGVIKQVEKNLFFVEPNEGEEIRKSADLIMIGKLQLDTNVKFVVGEKVKIIYDGYVMETYPAQVKAIRYENIEN